MPTFTYKARDPRGKAVKGTMQAASQEELYDKLQKLGYMTTKASESLSVPEINALFERFQRISAEDLIMFTVQFSNLINAGVSLLDSLSAVSQQIENRKLKEVVESVTRSVEAGQSFSEALSSHPKVFPHLFMSLVKAGEVSGKLDTILIRYAKYSEEQAELKQKVKGALLYPAILLFAGIGVSLFIVTFVVPQFAQIFIKVGITLPLPTRILYRVGVGIKFFWHSILSFVMVTYFGFKYYTGTRVGGFQVDQWKLRIPLLGGLFRKVSISRFSRTLGMLVSSGVPILTSLEIVKEVVGNEVLARVVAGAHEAVEKGEKLSEPLRVSREFPVDAIQLISVGEETGNLDEMLEKVADFYDRWTGYTIKKLTTLIEPVLLLLMGSIVGFIMASMLLPMFDMIKVLRQAHSGF